MDDKKTCGRSGCGKKLTAANRSGYCTKHFYDSKRKSDDVPVVTPAVHRGGQSNGQPKANALATLQVSREQLVAMFSALRLEEQVGCVQMWLNRISGTA